MRQRISVKLKADLVAAAQDAPGRSGDLARAIGVELAVVRPALAELVKQGTLVESGGRYAWPDAKRGPGRPRTLQISDEQLDERVVFLVGERPGERAGVYVDELGIPEWRWQAAQRRLREAGRLAVEGRGAATRYVLPSRAVEPSSPGGPDATAEALAAAKPVVAEQVRRELRERYPIPEAGVAPREPAPVGVIDPDAWREPANPDAEVDRLRARRDVLRRQLERVKLEDEIAQLEGELARRGVA